MYTFMSHVYKKKKMLKNNSWQNIMKKKREKRRKNLLLNKRTLISCLFGLFEKKLWLAETISL